MISILKYNFSVLFFCFTLIVARAQETVKKKSETPNIVLIFADDMGYGDIGSYGATLFDTPHLDKLASEGVRFTNFYVSQAVCSASRASILTGCYANRVGISGALNPKSKIGLNPDETTVAELLRDQGYSTAAVGKWHLGHHKEFLPLNHGFDEYLGIPYSNDMTPFYYDGSRNIPEAYKRKVGFPELPLIKGNDKIKELKTIEDQAQLTTLYTKTAIDFIERNRKNPFFLYLAHSMPHVPLAVSPKFKGKSSQGLYGDVIMEIDWSVGQIVNSLEKYGLTDNTLVIFVSDNGPWLNFGNHAGSAGGLREGKGTSFEGGQRVPCIMKWPKMIPKGFVSNQLAATMDILPTFAAITRAPLPVKKIDGVNLLPMLQGNIVESPRKSLYYYYQKNSLEAVRTERWKLVLPHSYRSYDQIPGKDGLPGAYGNGETGLALYDLRRDPGERYDVKDQNTKVVDALLTLAEQARKDLGDDLTNRAGENRRASGRIE